ncbi:predicted protein [Scheffersomyces stipitis CBS 6054]|uniref:DUF202 domain-containing protein n=1 Tax=Scheffersomyces stipitis (strain ATCC 58785 / CBS 6054 / NBRC 10063 / NRRL Y-11545) TaxID=322104 RepID=A3LTZ3_PICST|nr:predicted protein [Scheffersomyces stipitis CBS 6054]ABN66151.1 predicted protein [Scheffersomyces stipitis CBS 6054]
MANERTLLSWIRTAVTFVTFGIMFLQFFRLEEKSNFKYDIADKKTRTIHGMSRPLAGMCILLGLFTVLFGGYRYFEVQSLLMRSYYPATRLSIAVLILVNVALFVLLFTIDIKISI